LILLKTDTSGHDSEKKPLRLPIRHCTSRWRKKAEKISRLKSGKAK